MTTASEAEYQVIEREALVLSATNPRQSFDRASLDELKASIRESGIQVPLLVRSRKPDSGVDGVFAYGEAKYEVVAGARRFRAATELELDELPCVVRELTDDEAREAQITENLQREGVNPVEEAEAFQELLERLGSIPAVAARLGKEQAYVAKCLRLRALTLHARDALRGGLITIEHALLLARLAETEQNEALKWTLDRNAGSKTGVEKVVAECSGRVERAKSEGLRNYRWEPESVVKLKLHLEREGGIKLSRAPWDLANDSLLPDVPACVDCPKNTKANAPLFGDLDIDDPTCTDGACFQAKTAAFVQIAAVEAGADGAVKPVPRLSWKYSGVKPSIVSFGIEYEDGKMLPARYMANPAKLLKQGQWVEAKKGSCPNVRPGVTADWSDAGDRGYGSGREKLRKPGETLLVCIAVGCKKHVKDWEKWKSSNGNSGGPSQQEREAKEAEREKLEQQIEKVEPKIRTLVFQAMVRKLDGAKALRMANDRDHVAPSVRKIILEARPDISGEQLEALTAFGCAFSGFIRVNAYFMSRGVSEVNQGREALWKLAKQVGVDADQVAAKAFHDGLTPSLTCLYPKGVPWPGAAKAAAKGAKAKTKAGPSAKPQDDKSKKKVAAKKVAVKKAVKPVAKKAAKKKAGKG